MNTDIKHVRERKMFIATPSQMGEIDRRAISEYGIPGIVLMENAAIKVVEEIEKTVGNVSSKKILVFAGKGNNGGDAFAVVRHLFNKGASVFTYILGDRNSIKGDAVVNLNILDKIGVPIVEISTVKISNSEVKETGAGITGNGIVGTYVIGTNTAGIAGIGVTDTNIAGVAGANVAGTRVADTNVAGIIEQLKKELVSTDLIVDGIFGTGLKGEVKGIIAEVINIINSSGKTVVSIDIPSGLNGETGEVLGVCVRATKTVTFAYPKPGLILHPGCEYTGELIIADISIPARIAGEMGLKMNLLDGETVARWIPKRPNNTNKGDYGRILIIGGSKGMIGACRLCARAAHRTGAGLVYMAVPESLYPVYAASLTETIAIPFDDGGKGCLSKESIDLLEKQIQGKDVIAAGPGLSVNEDTVEIVRWLVKNLQVPLVLDADALNAISHDASILKELKATAVITPHPGEFARLTGKSISEIQKDRINAAKEFACKWNVITVLKGFRTVVALPDGTVYINPTGNPGMATAGTGDVLTGIIAGLIAQGKEPAYAACAGVYLHGLAGDRVATRIGEHGLIAGDLIEEIPHAILAVRRR